MQLETSGPGGESRRLARASEALVQSALDPDDPEAGAKATRALEKAGDAELAAAYTYLQQAVGVIAVLLPWVLIAGNFPGSDDELLGSISEHYYSRMGNVFVGALCALAVFFLSYNYRPLPGWERDRALSRGACTAAIGVALFPTLQDKIDVTSGERLVSYVHSFSAAALFVLLAVFCLRQFTQTGDGVVTEQKKRRNRLYRRCGWAIVAGIGGSALSMAVDEPESLHLFLWCEVLCVEAFGLAWLVKGGFLGWLADPPEPT